jgi:phage-related protein
MIMGKWKVYYYTSAGGSCAIRSFLERLPVNHSQKVAAWITMLEEEGPTLPRPFADLLENGIHELRIKLSGKQVRILYFFMFKTCIILTHAFIKKTSSVPTGELLKALMCREDVFKRFEKQDDLKNIKS